MTSNVVISKVDVLMSY